MKNKKRKLHLALTFLYAFVIFCTIFVTVLLSGGVLYLLLHFEIIPKSGDYLVNARNVILYMSFICVVLGSVSALLTSELSLKPLHSVIVQLKKLTEGDFKSRLHFRFPFNKHMTLEELSDSFNLMAEELENTDMLRGDFINNFSHEFKTPIVSIAGFAKLLKKENLTENQRLEYLNIIEEESLRLSSMATNVLNLTKVENQRILGDLSDFNLSEQIRSSVLLLEDRWSKKSLEFTMDFDEYHIYANEELLKQVWINLLDNAIKFSGEYGLIVIRILERKCSYIISVASSGIEIPLESREKIFNKFYQVDESHSSEGNGVGLAIVKKIVDLHKGKISVECKNGITKFSIEVAKKN